MDLQRGDLRVEWPQGRRGGLLLVVQRCELDLYRRAGEAEGAPATEAQRSLGPARGAAAHFTCAQGSALPCAPTCPNPRPMRVLISWDRAGGQRPLPPTGPHPCPRPRQLRPHEPLPGLRVDPAPRGALPAPSSSSSKSCRCGRGSGRKRPGPEGTPCPPLQVTARPSRHRPEFLSVCAEEPSALPL